MNERNEVKMNEKFPENDESTSFELDENKIQDEEVPINEEINDTNIDDQTGLDMEEDYGEDEDVNSERSSLGDPFENMESLEISDTEVQDVLDFDESNLSDAIASDLLVKNKCCRYLLKNKDEFEKYYNKNLHLGLSKTNMNLNLDCTINELRNFVSISVNHIDDFDENFRINLLDNFMRNRHELLSHKMMSCLKLSHDKTDIMFNEIFPISSKRTPDFILKVSDSSSEKAYLIIEVSAVSDVEKSAIRKGDLSKGYLSKYNREIEELKSLGFSIDYKVVIFDVHDANNNDHSSVLEELGKILNINLDLQQMVTLDFLRREFCNLTSKLNSVFGYLYNSLFGECYFLNKVTNFKDEFIFGEPKKEFTGNYQCVGVSSHVYDKIISSWPRLLEVLSKFERNNPNCNKLILKFDFDRSQLSFAKHSKLGLSFEKWYLILENEWYSKACENLHHFSSNQEIENPKSDFEFYSYNKKTIKKEVKYWLRDEEYFLDFHEDSWRIEEGEKIKDFNHLVESRKLEDLKSKYEDEDYEEKIIELLKSKDEFIKANGNSVELSTKNLIEKPLCNYIVNEESLSKSIEKYNKLLIKDNSNLDKIIVNWAKQPFIYPLYKAESKCFVSYKSKPKIIQAALDANIGNYTKSILRVSNSDNFIWGGVEPKVNPNLDGLRKKLAELNRNVLSKLKDKHVELRSKSLDNELIPFPRLKDLENFENLKEDLSKLNKEIREELKNSEFGESKKIGLVRMPSKPKTPSGKFFKEEMDHFKSKKSMSNYKGVALNADYEYLDNQMKNLMNILLMPSMDIPPENLYTDYVTKDSNLLYDLKKEYLEQYKGFKKFITGSNLYTTCCFISRLCHSLLYLSQTSLNSDYISVDNLGTNNSILLVKGGKKIFPTKRSKLFRLIYPTYNCLLSFYFKQGVPTSFNTFMFEGVDYIVTPWMNFHETVLTDGLSIHSRICGFGLLVSEAKLSFEENMKNIVFNILLALHNRRQTEVMLHNLRYIFMNCMSEISAIEDMLLEFSGFNYDFFQCWVRLSIKENFYNFATTLNKLHSIYGERNIKSGLKELNLCHPFTGESIRDLNSLALSVYSTYLMSKAPTTQSLEQVSNMKSIIEIQDDFVKNKKDDYRNCFVDLYKNKEFDDYYNEMFESDFNFDPYFCVNLGKFFGDYINNLESRSNLQRKWDSILDEPWDTMSNTKGLRGPGLDFFGDKGYYTVYKDILKREPEILKKINEIILSNETESFKQDELLKMNQSFRNRYSSVQLNEVVFHVVDKKQRGGKREIYVMDLETKVHQQTIEKYSAYLCKLMPNEMISIPSNKRLSTIHTRVFENIKEKKNKFYWVLDCRKWAPKSIVEKFMLFLSGARRSLPSSFLHHCYNFFYLLKNKKVFTRKYIFDILSKNKSTEINVKKYLKSDPNRKDGYYLNMKHSWVMGIFNYFSSMMHVTTQLYMSHLIRISSINNFNSNTLLHMVAHSDDSAGKLLTDDKLHLYRSSLYYELFMHSANHLISKKKSNMGRVYYEFLSILYIGGELLSLLAKFIGVFNFHPSDKGYCYDINESYSKCIELILNGATMSQAYLSLKIQSELIHRFYFNSSPVEKHYKYPTNMFGMPDAHPLMILILGSDSDVFRLIMTSDEKYVRFLYSLNENFIPTMNTQESLFRSFISLNSVRVNKKLKNLIEDNKLNEEICDDWSIKNVNFKNTGLNCMQFLNKLGDKNFISALQDETIVRRISRAFYHRSHNTTDTTIGLLSPKKVFEAMTLMEIAYEGKTVVLEEPYSSLLKSVGDTMHSNDYMYNDVHKKVFDFIYNEPKILHSYFNMIKFNPINLVDFVKTCKPVYIKIQKTTEECPIDFEPSSMVSWVKNKKLNWMLPNFKGLRTAENFLRKIASENEINVDVLNENTLFSICRKIRRKNVSEFYCYSNMPGTIREVTSYQDYLSFLSHNSFQNKYISGLSVQFGTTLSLPLDALNKDFILPDVRWTNSFLLLFCALLKSEHFEDEFLKLEVNYPDFLSNRKLTILELYNELQDYWHKRPRFFKYFKAMFYIAESLLNRHEIIDSDILNSTNYHTFIKKQFLVDNLWLGTGKLFISTGEIKLVVVIKNVKIDHVIVNKIGYTLNNEEIDYINICLRQSKLPTLNQSMKNFNIEHRGKKVFGVNRSGEYYIGENDDFVGFIDLIYSINLDTYLSKPEMGYCKYAKKGKITWHYNQENRDFSYLVNFYPFESTESVSLLKNFLRDNKNNREILMGKIGDVSNILLETCYKELDLELNVFFNEIIVAPTHTKIYKILQVCQKMRLCEVNFPEISFCNVPARDGGFLNTLICYSKMDKNFDFRWQHTTTPEYLAMKANQPTGFVSELMENLKEKYYNWYDECDRKTICKGLINIYKNLDTDVESDKKFMNLACTWGFVGVSGALEELEEKQNVENFYAIRYYSNTDIFSNMFSNLFLKLLNNVLSTIKKHLIKTGLSINIGHNNWFQLNSRNINFYIMSIIHQIVLRSYTKGSTKTFGFSFGDYIAKKLLIHILNDEDLLKDFSSNLESEILLKRLPLDPIYTNEWMVAYNSLQRTFIDNILQEDDLNFFDSVQRSDNLKLPFIQTKNYLDEFNIKISAAKVYHHGTISRQLISRLTALRKCYYEGKLVLVKPEVPNFKNFPDVPFNHAYWPKHPYSEEFLEDECFEDLLLELESDEPDLDEIENILENFSGDMFSYEGFKRVKIVDRGRLVNVLRINFSLMLMFSSYMNSEYLSKIRQSGDSFIIVTDTINFDLMKIEGDTFLFFKSRNEIWLDQTIMHPRFIFYIVCCKLKNKEFWENYLDAEMLTAEEKTSIMSLDFYKYTSSSGQVIDYKDNKSKIDWFEIVKSVHDKNLSRKEETEELLKQKIAEDELENNMNEERIKSSETAESSDQQESKHLLELIEESALDANIKNKIMKKVKKNFDNDGSNLNNRRHENLEDYIEEILKENSEEIIGGLSKKLGKLKEIPLKAEEQEMLYQIPLVYGGGRRRETIRKSNLLRDPELVAEMEAIQPGLIWAIVSGGLRIGVKMAKRWETQMKIYGRLMKDLKKNKKGKIFLLNLCRLFLNDASLSRDEDPCSEIWNSLYDKVALYMIEDEEDEKSDEDLFMDEPGGRVKYNISGEINMYDLKD